MAFQFATCDWNNAKDFLQQMYPSKTIDGDKIPKLVDLIKSDVLRVQDPNMHQPCQIVQGKSYTKNDDAAISEAIAEFRREVHDA